MNHQKHIFKQWNTLTEDKKRHLQDQLDEINWDIFKKQQSLIPDTTAHSKVQPLKKWGIPGDYRELGLKAIKEGKVGALIVAGGQGTRLGFNGPKGMYPILEDGTTLFEIFAKQIKKAGNSLPVALFTSNDNDIETQNFFHKNNYFGLSKEQLYFIKGHDLPFLDN